jgi:PPM family protein phosphatase
MEPASLQTHAFSHVGCVRQSNQDFFVNRTDIGCFMVADGMGGRAGGEIASQMTAETVCEDLSAFEALPATTAEQRRQCLVRTLNRACLRIYEQSLEQPQYKGMGTTATILWISNLQTAVLGHVGDSRCYFMRSGFLYQLTSDHSLVNEQIKAGILKKNDPMIPQIRNVITRCVGYQEEEEVDTFEINLRVGDIFLICSDGLTNKVSEIEISKVLSRGYDEYMAEELVLRANEMGGEDNSTAVIVTVI